MQNQEVREPAKSVVIIAPIWLQNVLSLWLQVMAKFKVVTCSTTFEAQLFYSRPDLVIYSGSYDQVGEQVRALKLMWPETQLLVFADATPAELRAAGADVVLPKEFSPEQLLNVMADLAWAA